MSGQKNWFEQYQDWQKRKKNRWWVWFLGLLLLLAFCDDDDRKEKRHCYNFGSDPDIRRACFKEPLPDNARCTVTGDGGVSCRIPN